MADFNLVDPKGWEYDLQSIYSAYMGYFQLHNIPWYERSWGVFFESFEEFLTYSWPVIVVTDCWTGKAHIVTRMSSIGGYLKMIKTRFGETLPMVDNILRVSPFETSQRHLRTVADYATYKKLHSTLPAAVLAALKQRVRDGEPKGIRELWQARDRTFLAIDFEWSERNQSTCLEWGYAAARCNHLEAVGVWPPDPEVNYRRGHYVVAEYADKVHNRYRPNFPWAYAFGDTQAVPKTKLPQIIQAVISSMASPDSETTSNSLVLVAHGLGGDFRRLEEMKIKIPHNVLVIDTVSFERQLFHNGLRGNMQDPMGKPRAQGSILSLTNLLLSLNVDLQCTMHNSGNDAFMTMLALQLLLDPEHTKVPHMRGRSMQQTVIRNAGKSHISMLGVSITPPITPVYTGMPSPSPVMFPSLSPEIYLDQDGSSRRSSGYFPNQPSPGGPRTRKISNLVPADGRGTSSHRGSSGVPVDEMGARVANIKLG